MYIEYLQINTIKINLSFSKSEVGPGSGRGPTRDAHRLTPRQEEQRALMSSIFGGKHTNSEELLEAQSEDGRNSAKNSGIESLRVFIDLFLAVTSSISNAPIVISGKV
jgi:hypothetical protein